MDTAEEAVCPFFDTSFRFCEDKDETRSQVDRPTTTFTARCAAELVGIDVPHRNAQTNYSTGHGYGGGSGVPILLAPFVNTCLTNLESVDCECLKILLTYEHLTCKSLVDRITQLARDTAGVAVCPFFIPPFVNTCLTKLESVDCGSNSVAMTRC